MSNIPKFLEIARAARQLELEDLHYKQRVEIEWQLSVHRHRMWKERQERTRQSEIKVDFPGRQV